MLNLKASFVGADHFFWRSIAIDSIDHEKLTAVYTGLDGKYLNPVVCSNFSDAKVEYFTQQVIDFYTSKKSKWSWYISNLDRPKKLPKYLEKIGLDLYGTAPKMYLDLTRRKLRKIEIKIDEVLISKQFKHWALPIRDGFGGDDDSFAHLLSKLPYGPGHGFRHYIAYFKGSPVSSCTLSLSRYGAKIDNMATITSMRGRGFGTALLNHTLEIAKQSGINFCYLDSSSEGFRLYKKSGFIVLGEQLIYGPKSEA